jgi:hypothetical protein
MRSAISCNRRKGATTKTYAYDADDRLWDITVGTAGTRYGYDANGNRKWAYRCGRSRRESLRAIRGFLLLLESRGPCNC